MARGPLSMITTALLVCTAIASSRGADSGGAQCPVDEYVLCSQPVNYDRLKPSSSAAAQAIA